MPKGNDVKIQTLLDNLVALTSINVPTSSGPVYLALYSSSPGGNNVGTEVVYSGYARQVITWGTPGIVSGVAEIKNTNVIEFETVPSSSGTVAHVGILTGLTGGTLIYYAPLGVTYTLNAGVKPTVPIGALTVFES
jgi:hypothetical protein